MELERKIQSPGMFGVLAMSLTGTVLDTPDYQYDAVS
jgi:hypothetical protein